MASVQNNRICSPTVILACDVSADLELSLFVRKAGCQSKKHQSLLCNVSIEALLVTSDTSCKAQMLLLGSPQCR